MDAQDQPAGETLPPTDPQKGLSTTEAAARLGRFGPNTLAEEHRSLFKRIFGYFWGPIPWLIEIAAILSLILSDWADFGVILAMLLVNAGVGFFEENKADSAIALLKQKLAPAARVLRDGRWQEIAAKDLVPGDLVRLEIGNIVPADLRLTEGQYLSVDEAALTGESLPVDKAVGDTAYSGSVVRLGEMVGEVTATGMSTYFGRTAALVQGPERPSHFQQAVMRIGNFLIVAALVLVSIILIVSIWRENPLWQTVQFALILTVAAIPVALPTVLSVTMAVGAERLARMKAIVSRLVSIEEMAGVDVLCSDKTGTLTLNQLTVETPRPAAGATGDDLLLAAALACNANAPDAIDQAVLAAADGIEARRDYKLGTFTPFDPVSKRTLAEARRGDETWRFAKGAPQVILDLAGLEGAARTALEAEVDALAAQGFRAIGAARAEGEGAWQFLGLIPIFDPPRPDAAETIAKAGEMGVTVKMITGDHEAIARQIAGQLGLGQAMYPAGQLLEGDPAEVEARVRAADGFARVLPEHKFRIVEVLQQGGSIVAMTGDGVNDAPALKRADAGIAVSGATDAARAAADLVLTGTGLSIITEAIAEARRIFERMTSYATFRIAETIRVLLFMSLAILAYDVYPVTAIMIVLLAVLNDFPIMMIAFDNVAVSPKPVRWDMRRVITIASTLGLMGVAETFLLFWYVDSVLHLPRETIQTLIFLKLLVSGHMTLYVTRNQNWFWTRPWPDWKLFATTEATQVIGTLIAVYGVLVTPIGWTAALLVWAYCLAWLPVEGAIAMAVRRLYAARRAAAA
ncbi:plasma-membrane proton-efflux P-type ATPase [Rhodovulum sulfidophilum]|uniref:Plasma-membrane proton-efflux P-type ATPase n=1 Tax=Rhodovulum visakhapatnamense TaxID=364297 RepID=A0ABS1RCB0_9RHOB|nr:plasma-membrane proton-efflux P-type ATPase [Rhodovulum visakhapatnamense]MBL3569312.1 plasma-membrane proton-efflux P-type ATPase [Rhodovulum visakhapatnamense]MBL3577282.1 plasma-membrane proton-efflux P-type ATPase [Rhodovulum visakhapatnamense]OLS45821.1 plasma-membrane proton-efflux P-type ATPase [Rhodovulum sulfidophilum]